MPFQKVPVVLWRDVAGAYTVRPIENSDDDAVGFGLTARAAREQLADYLAWKARREPLPEPSLLKPELRQFVVRVRPEYRSQERVYPCSEAVDLRIACVHGPQRHGLFLAVLPLMDVQFYFHKADDLTGLVDRYARLILEGGPPARLAQFLSPPEMRLERLSVRWRRAKITPTEAAPTEALSAVAEPLSSRMDRRLSNNAWERDREVTDLAEQLHQQSSSLLLLGEAGCGKSTLLVNAANPSLSRPLWFQERGPVDWKRRFWFTSAARLIAGMRYLGQWQERCEQLIAELQGFGGVLCVDKLLDLIRTGGHGPGDSLMAFFAPYLRRGELRMVAEATPTELDACRRLLPGCADLFKQVPVPTFDQPAALRVLGHLTSALEQSRKVTTEPGVSETVDRLFRRFQPYRVFPGPVVAFLRSLYDRRAPGSVVSVNDVIERFRRQTGLPELFLRDDLLIVSEELLAQFRGQIIGQDDAGRAASHLVTTFKAGLTDPNRPIGVLLFCGPTGVGKTEMAKALARCLFGAGDDATGPTQHSRLIRLDMSEYAGFDAASRLLGTPDAPSPLIRQMREQPFSVVLFDEIEKAADEVFDVLLGVCDEGRLTDRFGRVTTFRSAVVIMTSNLGATSSGGFGFGGPLAEADLTAVREFFRPEFFNRLDGVVRFQALRPEAIRTITAGELRRLNEREGLRAAGLTLTWSDRLLDDLARVGFDERYGARPLQRAIEQQLVAPLAAWLLEHADVRGQTIQADRADDGVAFTLV